MLTSDSGLAALVYLSGQVEGQLLEEAPMIFATDSSIGPLLKCPTVDKYLYKVRVVGPHSGLEKEGLPEGLILVEPPEDDLGDLPLCFRMVSEKAAGRVVVILETGSRVDQLLSNLACMNSQERVVEWRCGERTCFMVSEGQYAFTVSADKKEIGLASLGECKIHTSGFKWDVDGPICSASSNEALAEKLTVGVESGRLIISL
jgi:hypothetical protein